MGRVMVEIVFFQRLFFFKRLFLVALVLVLSLSDILAGSPDIGIDSKSTLKSQKLRVYIELSHDAIRVGKVLVLKLVGRIEEGHHIYSMFPQGEFAPEPTRIVIENSMLTSLGKPSESTPKIKIDEAFEQTLKVHENDFWMKEIYLVNDVGRYGVQRINGRVEYQVCTNKICSFLLVKEFNFTVKILRKATGG
jgi:hypothetical protein